MQRFPGSAGPGTSSSSSKPASSSSRKRARTESTNSRQTNSHTAIPLDEETASDTSHTRVQVDEEATSDSPRPRRRAAVACTTCRARKTKCDGVRPTCGYCNRTRSTCQYDGDYDNQMPQQPSLSCQSIGHEVLQAVQHLTQVVQQQATHRPRPQEDSPNWFSSPEQNNWPAVENRSQHHEEIESDRSKGSGYRLATSDGLDSILKWKVFPPDLPTLPVDNGESAQLSDVLPSTASSYLKELVENYIIVVHTKNPMLDLTNLRYYVAHVAENGFDWSTRACMVSLVCAIGALCREPIPGDPAFGGGIRTENEEAAYRFWSVAAKRLGLAMTYNTMESAQCLCLSGIWLMCCLQPLEAWKHFTMAGNAWYSAIFARSPRGNLDETLESSMLQTLEQSTFYTSYKSELEIRYELGIHGSVLERIDDRIVFPVPPLSLDAIVAELSPDEGGVTWYFYLSDIAARHLINRILESRSRIGVANTPEKVRTLLYDYEMFISQLNEWYQSLPPAVSFDLPDTTISSNLHQPLNILRSRYLFIHELLCRPFLRICLDQTVHLPEELITKIVALASLGLQYCAWKLQISRKISRWDHGLWIGLRIVAASSFMLIGAVRGKRTSSLNAAAGLQVPEDWRELILNALANYGELVHETKGGVAHCIQLVHHGLSDFVTSP